jgi:KaiC/GvpD/RAD55 family RecA-like ATPase
VADDALTLDSKLQSIGRFVKEDVPRTEWAIDDVWPKGASGLIAGPPKAGKSTMSLELAISLACGVDFLGLFRNPHRTHGIKVTYIQAENSTGRVRRDLDEILVARGLGFMDDVTDPSDPAVVVGDRFQPTAWGRGEPDLLIGSHTGLNLFDDDHQRAFIEHACTRDYVILDPIYLLAELDPNDMGDVNRMFRFLNLVREVDTAVIITHQMSNKQGKATSPNRILGSTMFNAWYESAILTGRAKDDTFSVTFDNLREMGESQDFRLQGEGTGRWEMLEDSTDSEGKYNAQIERKRARFRSYIEERRMHPRATRDEMAAALGVSTKTIQRYEAEAAAGNTGATPPPGNLYDEHGKR